MRLISPLNCLALVFFALESMGLPQVRGAPKPATEMPPDVVLEWQHAGAKPGWMRTDTWGRLGFCTEREEPEPGDLPAFELYDCQKGRLEALPAPSVPFGLSLRGVAVEDTDLDELTRFGASRLLICAAP